MLGLCCCALAFSSCNKWRPLCSCDAWAGFLLQWLLLLWSMGPRVCASVTAARRLTCPGSGMWDLSGPGIEQILNHWTTRGALNIKILKVHAVMSSSHCILTHPGLKSGVFPYTYAAKTWPTCLLFTLSWDTWDLGRQEICPFLKRSDCRWWLQPWN